jgi:hypothetical protein
VLLLAAVHVAAWGLAGFGECMADEEPAEAVGPVRGLLLAQVCVEQDGGQRFPQRERWLGDRGPGAEQRDEVRMSQQCGSRRVRGRAEVAGPLAGAPGERDLGEDEFGQAVEQRGLVRDVPVDGHRVDA